MQVEIKHEAPAPETRKETTTVVYTPNPDAGPRKPSMLCTVTRNISLEETLEYRHQLRPRLYACDPTITHDDIVRAFGIMAADLYVDLGAGKRLLFRGHCETKPDWSFFDQLYLNMKLQVEEAMNVHDITMCIYYTISYSSISPLLDLITTVTFDTIIHNSITKMCDPNADNPSVIEIKRLLRVTHDFTSRFPAKPAFAVMYKHLLSLTPFLTPDWERMTGGKTFAVRQLYKNLCGERDGIATIDINKSLWNVWVSDFSKNAL